MRPPTYACKFTNTGTTTFDNMVYGQIGVVSCDDNGNVIYSNGMDGYPCFPWWRVEYLHLEPGESTVFEFTVGSEVMKTGNYKYSYSVDYYKNHHQNHNTLHNLHQITKMQSSWLQKPPCVHRLHIQCHMSTYQGILD
jgi:hypothetical protein